MIMKKIIVICFIIVLQFSGLSSKEYINPDGGDWLTIDSALAYYDIGSNAPSIYFGLSCYDSLNCIGHYGDFLSASSYSRIRKTTDGGETWFDIRIDSMPITYSLRRFIFYPEKDLIVVGCDSGYVLRSDDGGKNWDYSKKITTLTPAYFQLNSMYMNGKVGIMSYSGMGNLFITKDGGENWSKMQFNTIPKINYPATFSIINSNTMFMCSWVNTVNDTSLYFFKSNDTGKTWTQINKFLKKDNFYSFFAFINENVGFSRENKLIVKGDMIKGTRDTSLTTFHKTTDGGLTWNKFYEIIKQGDGYSNLVAADELNLIASNLQAGYLKTTDGGLTWEKSDYFTYEGEYQGGYNFSNPIYLTTKNPLITSGPRILKYVGKINSLNDKSINLLNLSPNPATDYIQIQLSEGLKLEEGSVVEIYNSFGELVMKDVAHLNSIDVSHLPVGLYFVKIGDRIEKFVKM